MSCIADPRGLAPHHRRSTQCKFTSILSKGDNGFYWFSAEEARFLGQFYHNVLDAIWHTSARLGACWERASIASGHRQARGCTGGEYAPIQREKAAQREFWRAEAPSRVLCCPVQGVSWFSFGLLRPGAGICFRRQRLRGLFFLATVIFILAVLWQPAPGAQGGPAHVAPAAGNRIPVNKRGGLFFAEPLHGDPTSFVTARVEAALAEGTSPSQAPWIAAEAASEIAWGECSRLCNGGTQTADREAARTLAMEGLRRALSGHDEWSEAYMQEAGDQAAKLGLGDGGDVKTRPCNTFRCPPEIPTDIRMTVLQVARDPVSVGSFGVIPQVEFSEACKTHLKLDQLQQEDWARRRMQHLERLQLQGSQEEQGWEAAVLAPSQLSLYSCVSLCRLSRRCGAVIYVEDVDTVETGGSDTTSGDADGPSLDTIEAALDRARSAAAILEKSAAGVHDFGSPVERSDPSATEDRNPTCTLYGPVKVSRVSECLVEPPKRGGKDSLTLLVLDPNVDFADTARAVRMAAALELEKYRAALDDALHLTSTRTNGRLVASRNEQRTNRLTSKIMGTNQRSLRSMHVLSEAVRVLEGAALQAATALAAAQSAGESAIPPTGAGNLQTGKRDSGPLPVDTLYPFHSARPLSDSCPMFEGVELLGRGCVQLPALQMLSSVSSSVSLDNHTTDKPRTPNEITPMTWQRCLGSLQDMEQLLAEYRSAVSQVKAEGAKALDASTKALRFIPLLLGLDSVQAAKLSASENTSRLHANDVVTAKDDAAALEELDALRSRKEVVERLGEGSGSIFGVFDTAHGTCEIRAVRPQRSSLEH